MAMSEGRDEDRSPLPATYHQYFVCGLKIDYEGNSNTNEEAVRFFGVNGSGWHTSPENATRCNESMALEFLSQKQNVVSKARKDDFFIVRADITLTRVKVTLEDL